MAIPHIYNWVQARFADGTHFVSDAPPDRAAQLERRFPLSGAPTRLDVGVLSLDSATRGVYFRWRGSDGVSIQHVLVSDAIPGAVAGSKIEAVFAERYGQPFEERIETLAESLRQVRVSEATATLAELFVEGRAVAGWRPTEKRFMSKQARRTPRDGATLPWLIAVTATGLAAWLGGAGFAARTAPILPATVARTTAVAPDALPPVGASPRSAQVRDEEVERLGLQLVTVRRRHAEQLEVRDRRIGDLEEELVSLREEVDAAPAAPEGTPARVTASVLWVRRGPETDQAKVMGLVRGTAVRLGTERREGWARIVHPAEGWAAARYLEVPPSAAAEPASRAERRAPPSERSRGLGLEERISATHGVEAPAGAVPPPPT